MHRFRSSLALIALVIAIAALPVMLFANHSWNGYHWARTSNPFTLKVGDNVGSTWDGYLQTAAVNWSRSSVLDMTVVAGGAKRNCRPTSGRVEVCNSTYGNNGWLGIAQVWVSGSHITQGTVKLNDTYFNTPAYNTSAWRNMVTCQEVGHTLGLDHQDTTFDNANLGTCMDYTDDPTGSDPNYPKNCCLDNEFPNQHDYDELVTIYTHLDGSTTVGQSVNGAPAAVNQLELDGPGQWGQLVRENKGRKVSESLYEADFGNGHKVYTFVLWAQ